MNTPHVQSPGCVVFLIDESAAMKAEVQEDAVPMPGAAPKAPKSKAESVATALNALLKQLTDGPDFDVALVGYHTTAADEPVVTSRWSGAFAGRDFVSVHEYAESPLAIEGRVRKRPNPSGFGPPVEETVSFPVWYVPTLGANAPQVRAFEHCRQLLENWIATAGPDPGTPLVVHIFAGGSADGNPLKVVEEIQQLPLSTGSPLVFQAHLSTAAKVPATLYSSNRAYLPLGPIRDLFERASLLPEPLVEALREATLTVQPKARGMLYNAKMVDVVRFLSLVKAHTRNWPPRPSVWIDEGGPATSLTATDAAYPAESPADAPMPMLEETADWGGAASSADTVLEPLEVESDQATLTQPPLAADAALLVFLLDRSVDDPYGGDMQNPFRKLQEHANALLAKLARSQKGEMLETAVISYGADRAGAAEVRTTFEGPLTEQTIVKAADLAEGALRVDESEQQVPNGLGGLMTRLVKKPIYVELDPTAGVSPQAAFTAAAEVIEKWCGEHPVNALAPVVLHLTRGRHEQQEIEQAAARLREVQPASGPVVLYHLVATQDPHRSLAYCDSAAEFEMEELRTLWELSSPLLGVERLAAEQPLLVKPEARGIVVNGEFNLLLEGIEEALGGTDLKSVLRPSSLTPEVRLEGAET